MEFNALMPASESRSMRAARHARAALDRASRRAIMAAAVALGATFLMGANALAAPAVGQPAPEFVAIDTAGNAHRLSDFAGKFVVLEWTNPGCPVVRNHYSSHNIPETQKAATSQGVIWLAIASSERAAGDYLKPAALDDWMKQQHAAPTAVLMDEDGAIGQAYGARATPHIFIVDPKGMLVYAGAIDSIASARTGDIRKATNYVSQALGEAFDGRPISASVTRAYGSPVKYKT
jgi:peroxiredoxin